MEFTRDEAIDLLRQHGDGVATNLETGRSTLITEDGVYPLQNLTEDQARKFVEQYVSHEARAAAYKWLRRSPAHPDLGRPKMHMTSRGGIGKVEMCKAPNCGRKRCHLGPCVEDPKPGVAYTDGLGSLGCGSWPRDEYGNVIRSLLLANEERAPQIDPETPAEEG